MGDSKGKGRAPPREEDINTGRSADESSQGASLISRVADSASGLSRSVFGAPSSNELNETAARALENANKGHSSSSGGSSAWTETSESQHFPSQAEETNAFRADHNEQHMKQSELEFSSFLDGIDSFSSLPSDVVGVDHHLPSDQFGGAWLRSQTSQEFDNTPKSLHRTVDEQKSRDGEDVLALLSQPGSLPLEVLQEDEEYDWGLSAEQLSQLRAMTKDLFSPPEAHNGISSDNPLNLAPRFDKSHMVLGTQDEAAAQENWRNQWEGVLTRYSDEVWGGLLPLVREARKEVEDLRNKPSGPDQPKALRRLGAILGHLRTY